MSIRILDNITTGYKPNVFSDFNVMNSKLSIKEEIRMETQMVCPDDYVKRDNIGCLPGWKEKDIPYAYGSKLRTKLDEIHKITRERMKIKSNENKAIEKFSKNK
ncbi:hypothetical protein V1478_002395 [Vespula squamosa]|uniref:Uncharacterized protein n=1 Tax=Vespula squamosa TaxID=30214 RepID=A0ABD2BVR1_VESSQ